jgi:hypothetical protein
MHARRWCARGMDYLSSQRPLLRAANSYGLRCGPDSSNLRRPLPGHLAADHDAAALALHQLHDGEARTTRSAVTSSGQTHLEASRQTEPAPGANAPVARVLGRSSAAVYGDGSWLRGKDRTPDIRPANPHPAGTASLDTASSIAGQINGRGSRINGRHGRPHCSLALFIYPFISQCLVLLTALGRFGSSPVCIGVCA